MEVMNIIQIKETAIAMKTIELQFFILFYKCQGQCSVNAAVTNDKDNNYYKFSIYI